MDILIYFLVFLVIAAIVWWVIGQLGLPPPFHMVAVAVFAIIAIILLLRLLPSGGNLRLW